jgi:hypothetical protein
MSEGRFQPLWERLCSGDESVEIEAKRADEVGASLLGKEPSLRSESEDLRGDLTRLRGEFPALRGELPTRTVPDNSDHRVALS